MPRSRADRRRRASLASGFTLIEVVVALAIAGLGLAFLMAAAGTGIGNARTADRTMEAMRRAQSHLAEVGSVIPLAPGERSGNDGGVYSWRVRISQPQVHAGGGAAPQGPPSLFSVEVTVSWQNDAGTKSVSLRSERLGPGAANG